MATLLEQALATQTSPQSELLIEIYYYRKDFHNPHDFVALARLAVRWNDKLDDYPWWHRPCFEVHVGEDRVPHLRATVTYFDVRDCWYLVGLFLDENDSDIVVKFWDDGDLLLTEAAYHLPDWVHTQSEDEVEYCLRRCWIWKGQVILVPPAHDCSSISQALSAVRQKQFDVASAGFHKAIRSRIPHSVPLHQCTAIAVPRQVAFLLQEFPQVGNEAAAAFVEQALSHSPQLASDRVDWVWTTHSFGRTQYAALRTAVSRTWPDSERVPFRTPELNRLLRQANNDAMPHLRHGVALGVRIVSGLEHLLSSSPSLEPSVLERWPALLAQTGSDPSWFLSSYQAGPNHASIDIDIFLKLDEQCRRIRNGPSSIRSILKKGIDQPGWDGLPKPSELDEDESWMTISDDPSPAMKDTIIEHQIIESFLQHSSDYDGIQVAYSPSVNPTAFLNILQATLKAKQPQDLAFLDQLPDPYFAAEDYELAEGEEDGDDEDTITMKDVMEVMDQQLMRDDDEDIVKNWKQSLEESIGGSGPVQTILQGLP